MSKSEMKRLAVQQKDESLSQYYPNNEEPVAWMVRGTVIASKNDAEVESRDAGGASIHPLYLHPAPQPDQNLLHEILCIIHRDGGHYIAEHGELKAYVDACEKLHRWKQVDDYPPPQPVNEELLAALKAFMTHMGMDEDEWNKPTYDQARRAIAKAEGTHSTEHPLSCLHINRGSFDAAADAYELEYAKAKCRESYDNTFHKIRADIGYDDWEKAWLKGYKAAILKAEQMKGEGT